jgi:DegV family protein with EDD domain
MLKIVTDGGADFPGQWQDLYEIFVIPLRIQFGDRTFVQGQDIGPENFYQLVREYRMIPKTSLPSPGQIVEFYKKIAQKGDTILSVHLGSKLSGTFSAVSLAASELIGDMKVIPFDSGAGSAILAMMCREARLLDQAGFSINDILARLAVIREKLVVVFTLDTLEFARMNGRVNALQSAISSALRIKPIVILRDGLLQMAEKVRTRQKAIDQIVNIAGSRVGNQPVNVAVVHADDPQMAEWLVIRVRQLFNCKEIIQTALSIPVAANLGPGAVGIMVYPVN